MNLDDDIRDRLRAAVPPWDGGDLNTDLWPRMLRRLEEPRVTFGWFEAILAGAAVFALVMFPELLPSVLFNL